jgi:hypothetical protein
VQNLYKGDVNGILHVIKNASASIQNMFNVKKVEIIPVKLCSFFCLEEKDVD